MWDSGLRAGLTLAANAARGQHVPAQPELRGAAVSEAAGSEHTHRVSIMHVSDVLLQPNKLSGLNF